MTELSMLQPSQVITKSFVSNEYNLYLHGEISHDANEYLEHFAVYHQAGPEDLIRLWVQSPGGSVAVGNQYIRHMKQCAAPIVAVIGMECASQATAVVLAASDWEVDEMSTFLVHGFSYGAYGHEAQVFNQATFNKKLNEKYMRSTYSGFLDENSILEALKGVDLLFDGEELVERLQKFKEYRNSQPCPCGEIDCPQNQRLAAVEEQEDFGELEEFSLEDMISNAVADGIAQYEKKRLASEKKAATAAKKKPVKVVEEK